MATFFALPQSNQASSFTSPPLISDTIAHTSIALYIISLSTALVTACSLLPKVVRLLHNGELRPSNATDEWTAPCRIGKVRVVLLFVCAIVYFCDSVSTLIFTVSVWTTRTGNPAAMWVVRLFANPIAAPLVAMATTFRVSVIISTKPRLRLALIYGSIIAGVCVTITLWVTFISGIAAIWGADLMIWLRTPIAPVWAGFLPLVITAFSLGGAIWSLKVAFADPSAAMNGAGGSSGGSSSDNDGGKQGGLKPVASASAMSMASTATTQTSAPKVSDLQMTLHLSFKALSFFMAVCWIVFIIFATIDDRPLPVRGHAVRIVCATFVCASEASFEWILSKAKKLAKKQQQQKKRNSSCVGPASTSLKFSNGAV